MRILVGFIGKTLNSLKYQVDKNIKETLYQNEAFLSSKWNIIEHNIVRWSRYPFRYVLLLLVTTSLLIANYFLWKDDLAIWGVQHLPHWKKLIEWQGGFLAGQLTIIGVIYPLVIGLVGVLFQNKAAKKVLLPIYQTYSGFMFAGLSGLVLSISIVGMYFLSAFLSQSEYLIFCVLTAAWLSFNVLLTIWFFKVTFSMLDDTTRDRLIVQYTIHELCEADIRLRIRDALILRALENKILINPDPERVKVSTFSMLNDKYEDIAVEKKGTYEVSNIYFLIINIVINYNLLKSKLYEKFFPEKDFNPEIVLQPRSSSKEVGTFVLAKHVDLDWLSIALLRASFSLKKSTKGDRKSISSMILGFTGSAKDAMRERNTNEFTSSIDNIVEWHSEIAQALSFKNDDKEDDNWLLLENATLFGRNNLDEMLREYLDLSRSAVELIPEDITYFDKVIVLYKKIYLRRSSPVQREGHELIKFNYFTWMLLMEWRSYNSSSSDTRIANKYEDVLYDFVGAWESWLDFISPKRNELEDLTRLLQLLLSHLQFTSQLSVLSLRYGNIEAAGWGVDMLNNWVEKMHLYEFEQVMDEYNWLSQLVTHDLLSLDSSQHPWPTILKGNDFNKRSAFNLALRNTVFDLRIITACYMLLKPRSQEDEKIKEYVEALLSCSPIHPTGAIGGREKVINSASDVLGAYIRHCFYQANENSNYNAWLSGVLESFSRVNEQRRISGRIYSGWGREDPQSMNLAYVEIAIFYSSNKWNLNTRWLDMIFSDLFTLGQQEALIRELEEWIGLADKLENPILLVKEDSERKIENFKESIRDVIDTLGKKKTEIIVGMEVDKNKLVSLENAASRAIVKEDGEVRFPVSLFEHINFDSNSDEQVENKLRITNYPKQRVAKDIDANRPVNEDDWIEKNLSETVKNDILSKVFNSDVTGEYRSNSLEDCIGDISSLSKDIVSPVLFSGSSELNSLLRQANYKRDMLDKYNISFIDGYGYNYICHIGKAIVYGVNFTDVDYCLLTSLEMFQKIEFGKTASSSLVSVDFVPDSNDQPIGTLLLKYLVKITLRDNLPLIKITPHEIHEE
jgi:hypothetical protein